MHKTPCHAWHQAQNARLVDFAGWEMPIQYSTITDEHNAVRNAVGLFDIAHMGRLEFTGPHACALLDHLVTNDVTKLTEGQIRYALVTNEQGGILDDVLVYRFSKSYMLVVNASNREKIVEWIQHHQAGFDTQMRDLTTTHFMLALQGPRSVELLNPFAEADVSAMKYYTGIETTVCGHDAIVSRTGYTGEDGFEVIVDNAYAEEVWTTLFDAGQSMGLLPTGLGCRDTLRLEAGMPLYGHELDEQTHPFSADLGFAVKLKAGDFLGKAALVKAKEQGGYALRVGLELEGRRIAREGAEVFVGDDKIGTITSGTFSPTLEKPIAMAYLAPEFTEIGHTVDVDIRGKKVAATIVKLPFYSRK